MDDKIRFVISGIAGVLILSIFLYYLGIERLIESIKNASLTSILIGLSFYLVFFVVRSLRWQIILIPIKNRTSFQNLFTITILGWFTNSIIPIRIGELVRAVLLKNREDILISEGLSSIVIERIFDLAGLVVVGGAMFYFLPDDASIPKEFASFILLVLGFIAFSILLLLLLNYRYDALIFPVRKFVSVVFWFSKGIKDRILENLTLAINAMLSICKSKYMVPIFLLSIITWLSPCFMYLYFFRAFNINFHWSVIFLGSVLVTLTFLIPSAPGYLGTFEAAWVFVYLGLGIAVEKALPVGLAVHFTTLFFIIVLGYIGLVIYGIGRRDVFGMISERI